MYVYHLLIGFVENICFKNGSHVRFYFIGHRGIYVCFSHFLFEDDSSTFIQLTYENTIIQGDSKGCVEIEGAVRGVLIKNFVLGTYGLASNPEVVRALECQDQQRLINTHLS